MQLDIERTKKIYKDMEDKYANEPAQELSAALGIMQINICGNSSAPLLSMDYLKNNLDKGLQIFIRENKRKD